MTKKPDVRYVLITDTGYAENLEYTDYFSVLDLVSRNPARYMALLRNGEVVDARIGPTALAYRKTYDESYSAAARRIREIHSPTWLPEEEGAVRG